LPDLFRGDQLVLTGRYRGEGNVTLVLEGQADGKPHTDEFSVQFSGSAGEHEFVPRLWATRRVGYLLDEIRLRGESAELRDEAAELARRYGVVTPYTAYLIVEDEARRNVPLTVQSLPQAQRDGVTRSRMDAAYAESHRSRYGIAAVSRARSEQALKQAQAPEAAVAAGAFEGSRPATALASPPPTTAAGRQPTPTAPGVPVAADRSQFVQGRTFYLNDGQWVDSRVQTVRNARQVNLKVGASDYFALLRREPRAAEWLALGQRVQFVLRDTVYTVEP
jgi:Ca-activated chloride channel family protein